MKPIKPARAPWLDVILVCAKCARKAGRKRFAKELKGALKGSSSGRPARVVEVGCLDLCPKRRLTLATGPDLAAGRLWVLPGSTDASEAAAHLKLHQRAN